MSISLIWITTIIRQSPHQAASDRRLNRSLSRILVTLCVVLAAGLLPSLGLPATTGAFEADRAPGPNCAALGLASCPQPFDAAIPAPASMLQWDQKTRVIGFRNTYRQYPGDVFHTRGAEPYPLPRAAKPLSNVRYQWQGHQQQLTDYLKDQSVTGLLIIKDGRIAYEYYGAGNTERTLWTSRSVAKSVVSVLTGIAVHEGLIHSMDDSITQYLPELSHTAWDGVSLRQLIRHTSGVAWNEHYADPNSDFAKLTRCEASSEPYDCVLKLISGLLRVEGVKPGERWSYNTAGAWIMGRVLEKATGMPIASYLESRLWSRYAMEHDGVWQALVPGQIDMGGHGFNATLKDWGRFAWFVAGGGVLRNGEHLLDSDWIAQSTDWTQAKGSVTPAAPQGQFGYQWWYSNVEPGRGGDAHVDETARQTFWAEGIYGQTLAINPKEKLVLVQWSTWAAAETPASLYDEQALFFDGLVRALH